MNKEEFVEKVNLKYGNGRYFVLGEYKNNKSKVLVRCNECGYEWKVNAGNFINVCKVGCPKCAVKESHDKVKLTTEEIIKRGKQLYGNRYSYDKLNSQTRDKYGRVCFTCNICGEDFLERPSSFLSVGRRRKSNCPNCVRISVQNNLKNKEVKQKKHIYVKENAKKKDRVHDTKSFIEKAKLVHGDEYIYDEKTKYINSHSKVIVKCKKHGYFEVTPTNHLNGVKCKKCRQENKINPKKKTFEAFLAEAKNKHGDKYKYDESTFVNYHIKMRIICPIHGEFWQEPSVHIAGDKGHGCPQCKESRLERIVRICLNERNIVFESGKHFDWLGKQHFDFYLVDYNIAIECQGKQHFGVGGWNNKKALKETIERDIKKYNNSKDRLKIFYLIDKCNPIDTIIDKDEFGKIYTIKNAFNNIKTLLKRI